MQANVMQSCSCLHAAHAYRQPFVYVENSLLSVPHLPGSQLGSPYVPYSYILFIFNHLS